MFYATSAGLFSPVLTASCNPIFRRARIGGCLGFPEQITLGMLALGRRESTGMFGDGLLIWDEGGCRAKLLILIV